MASESPEPPEGFKTVDAPGSENDDDAISLEEGEHLQGEVLRVEEDATQYGNNLYIIDDEERGVVDYYGNNQIDSRAGEDGFGKGDQVWIHKTPHVESFENDDGEEIEYHVFKVAVLEDGN